MSPIKFLKRFLYVENLLGIYRNYDSQQKIKKRFIIFHIFVLILVHTIIFVNEIRLLSCGNSFNQMKLIHAGFSFVSYANALSSVVTGISSSRVFISYIKTISHVSECFRDYKFVHAVKKIYWFCITSAILCLSFSLYRSTQILIAYIEIGGINVPTLASVFVSQGMLRVTIIYQKIVLLFVIMTVVQLAKCLNSIVSVVQNGIRRCDISSDERFDITKHQIQEWVEVYRDLARSCERVTLCFGRQFIFSFIMSMSYYMLLTNHMCNKKILNKPAADFKTLFVPATYIAIMMLPIIAAQLARNQGIKFHRVLARLYNIMIVIDSREAEAKLIKDFIRLMKKNPIEIKLLPNAPAGMYMVPVILTMTVNYIIVIMQFNNVF